MQELKPILPRAIAKQRGIPRFYTGKQCRYGHLADRVASSGNCLQCQRAANAKHFKDRLQSRRQDELRDLIASQNKAYLERNREAISARRRARYAERHDEMLDRRRNYYENNLPTVIATNARMVQRRKKRMPTWLSREQISEIVSMYILAARMSDETGVKHHVDHIVPLQGRIVSGLHVPWNLRVITAAENLRKGNRMV